MTIQFESEYTHGEVVNLKVEKGIPYIVTGWVIHEGYVTYELSNSEGSFYKHGVEIEKYVIKSVRGLK